MVDRCAALGILYKAYSALGGADRQRDLDTLFPRARERAGELGISLRQLLPLWHLRRSPTLVPVVGASRVRSVVEAAVVLSLTPDAADVAVIDQDLADRKRATTGAVAPGTSTTQRSANRPTCGSEPES